MLYSVISWSLTAILGVWSLILLSGHGAASIAGFNTMTEDEKENNRREKALFCSGYLHAYKCVSTLFHGYAWIKKYNKHNSNHCGQYYCD